MAARVSSTGTMSSHLASALCSHCRHHCLRQRLACGDLARRDPEEQPVGSLLMVGPRGLRSGLAGSAPDSLSTQTSIGGSAPCQSICVAPFLFALSCSQAQGCWVVGAEWGCWGVGWLSFSLSPPAQSRPRAPGLRAPLSSGPSSQLSLLPLNLHPENTSQQPAPRMLN